MKKAFIVFCLVLFVTGLAAAGGSSQPASNSTMYIAVNIAELKSNTGAFANTVGTLNYGTRVTVLQESGRFMQVRSDANPSLSGWTAGANLTAKQIVPGTTSSATAGEVALAGKGFNKEVETSYRNQHGELNYAAVDLIEKLPDINNKAELDAHDARRREFLARLQRFLAEGNLAMGGS